MFGIAIYSIVEFTETYKFLFGLAYFIKAYEKTEPEAKVMKIQTHELLVLSF